MRSASSIHSTHPVLAGGYDNTRYTVMSYTVAEPAFSIGFAVNGNTISTTSQRVIVTTPMVLDIAAVQSIYGADPNTASGDTVYHFTQGDTLIKAIYDAGGTDTSISPTSRGPCCSISIPAGIRASAISRRRRKLPIGRGSIHSSAASFSRY
jgi:hypothetical protein